MEVRLAEERPGRSCRSCARWDGSCTHPRHANDDPSRPCLMYRYREQVAVEPPDLEPEGIRRCSRCKKWFPVDEFAARNGGLYATCQMCRKANREKMRRREARRKESNGHDA